MSPRPAVFVDRDGVVNALVVDPESGLPESPLRVEDVVLLDGAVEALLALREAGYLLVCVTNQPGAAKEKVSVATLLEVNEAVRTALHAGGVDFDDVRICLHHPEGTLESLRGPCDCRKPEPGMLLDAAAALDIDLSSSWMIGDSDADTEAGRRAGCRSILVENPDSAHRRGSVEPDERAPDLRSAAMLLLRH